MSERQLAVMFVHGVEINDKDYAKTATKLLRDAFKKHSGVDPDEALVIEAVLWAPVLQEQQDKLFERTFGQAGDRFVRSVTELVTRIGGGSQVALLASAVASVMRWLPFVPGRLNYPVLRWIVTQMVADAVAYKPSNGDHCIYNQIHAEIAETNRSLAERAGGDAPLCVIAHSLGSVIMSNYFYDLQVELSGSPRAMVPTRVRERMGDTPIERGETLAFYYTLGSPIALWTTGYTDFGIPLTVPSPGLHKHHPDIEGEWVNFYDRDDVIAYPLQELSHAYKKLVSDREVSLGPWWSGLTPLTHPWYWNDKGVMDAIGKSLADAWHRLNGD